MSKLLKSKFLFGVLVVAVLLVVGAVSANAAYMHTVTLRQGSTGPQVVALQQALGGLTADGNFGPMTKAAVMAYQTAHGLTADGVVGPMTGASLAGGVSGLPAGCSSTSGYSTTTGQSCSSGSSLPAGCTSTAGYSPTTGAKCDGGSTSSSGPLEGGAGSITVTALSTYGSEKVGEDAEDVKVAAFEVEADNDSDVELTSMKVELNQQNTADDEDMDNYMTSVSVFMGSEKVGEADVEDFTETTGHVWSKSISLDNAVIRSGDTEKFSLAVTSVSNIDSADMDSDDWQIGVSNIRFLDGDGVSSTESLTLDIDDDTIDDTVEEAFDFKSFADAESVELKAALVSADEDINESHVVNVDDADDTDGVAFLSFTLEAKGSDVNVSEIPVLITTTEASGTEFNDPDDVLVSAHLLLDDEEIATESFLTSDADGDTEVITFDDLDIDISEGDKAELKVTLDVQDTGTGLDDGDTIKVELDGTRVDLIEAEDESGTDLGTADLTGTALGEASTVYDVAFTFEFVSSDEEVTTEADPATAGSDTTGTFTMKYKITAFDGDVNIDKTCTEAGDGATPDEGTDYAISDDGNNSSTCTMNVSGADTATGDSDAWTVEEGTTATFTLTVAVTSSADTFAKVYLSSINWESDTTTPDTSPDLFFTAGLGEDKTSSGTLFLNTI